MTDDEEVQAMLQSGDRGESEAAEGTPEGTYVWELDHRKAFGPSASVAAPISLNYKVSGTTGGDHVPVTTSTVTRIYLGDEDRQQLSRIEALLVQLVERLDPHKA